MARTRDEILQEMDEVVAHARAAEEAGDADIYDLDHHRLSDLITEIEHVPLQRRQS